MLEKLGIVDPRDPAVSATRDEALAINDEARQEIHDSRQRRGILQLRMEHELRKGRRS